MAVRFDAATDRISYSASAPPVTFTITGWVYLSANTGTYATWLRLWDSAFSTVVTWATSSDGVGGPNYFTAAATLTNTTNLVVGGWRKVAITCTGTTAQSMVATPAGATEVVSGTVGTGTPFGVTVGGRGTGDAAEWLNGRVAYFRVWSSVLTRTQIEAEWASVTPVVTAGLWADWPLTSASDLTDHSGNGRSLVAGTTAVTTEADPPVATTYTKTGGAAAPAAGSGVRVLAHPPATVLNIGTGTTQNRFGLQYARPGDSAIITKTLAELAAGFSEAPYFTTTSNGQRVHFEARLDAPTTAGSSFSRAELREVNADGSDAGWDATTGEHIMQGTTVITSLPPVKPEVVIAQVFGNAATADIMSIRTQLVSSTIRLRARVDGTSVTSPQIAAPYTVGTSFNWKMRLTATAREFYWSFAADPLPGTPQISVAATTETSVYFKAGLYNGSNTAAGDAGTAIGAAELSALSVSHLTSTTYAKAGGAVVPAAGVGSETVTSATTVTKTGSAASPVAGSGDKAVTSAVVVTKSGSAAAPAAAGGVRAISHAKAGAAAILGAGSGVKAVTSAAVVTKTGGAVAPGAGVGSDTVTHAAVFTKSGSAVAVGVGFGVDVVAHPGSLTKAGAAAAIGAASGVRVMTGGTAWVKSGGAATAGAGSGMLATTGASVVVKSGGATAIGAGTGAGVVATAGAPVKTGGAVAVGAGTGVQVVQGGSVIAKTGGSTAMSIAAGTKTVVRAAAVVKSGGAFVVCAAGTRPPYSPGAPFHGGAPMLLAGPHGGVPVSLTGPQSGTPQSSPGWYAGTPVPA